MKITICCSKKYFPEIQKFLGSLNDSKNEFLTPDLNFMGEINETTKRKLSDVHHEKIRSSDAIYIYNPNNEIGRSTNLEMGFAIALNKKIFAFKKIGEPGLDCFIEKLLTLEELTKL
ncbi:MAG: hypothetical protein IB618_00365 [Candidatus Pacearchaeota archaeon]|nr:MAG: hypothetical protein IB618_00365 [Candidatus Pacearchaeota archaeon]